MRFWTLFWSKHIGTHLFYTLQIPYFQLDPVLMNSVNSFEWDTRKYDCDWHLNEFCDILFHGIKYNTTTTTLGNENTRQQHQHTRTNSSALPSLTLSMSLSSLSSSSSVSEYVQQKLSNTKRNYCVRRHMNGQHPLNEIVIR